MVKKRLKNPYRLTFEDVLEAATYLIRDEHADSKLCKECQRTLEMVAELKKRFEGHAIDSNLVWYAFRGHGDRRIWPDDKVLPTISQDKQALLAKFLVKVSHRKVLGELFDRVVGVQ